MSRLFELNALKAGAEGVYSHPDSAERDFAYSDGTASERYLFDVLSLADDLSSASTSLQQKIRDWPSEYHLSPRRANLLRPLPWRDGERVLELGCGCGAISRFLGESGCVVDAVEGSAVRASLARLRCRDLPDVRVVQANFNKLQLPPAEYDTVLLVGVAEYARRFSPDSDSDRGAVLDLLGRIRESLRPGGRVIIAIENRTGMKYLHGAHEDHYSLRFVGIDDYAESAGMRTYTRREWHAIAEDAGFADKALLLPFPDYKIPVVLLGESYCQRDPNAWCHLEDIDSADYTFLFDPYIPETIAWQGYNAAGVLADLANSFLFVLSNDGDTGGVGEIDFVHLPDFRRRREHCTVVTRRAGEARVHRRRLDARDDESTSEAYIDGVLLSSKWVRSIMIHPDPAHFHRYLRDYVEFLDKRANGGPLPLDLLPNNIIVDAQGTYRVFDQEWAAEDGADADYLLFRATLTFASHYRAALRQFARRFELYDVGAFIRHCFRVVNRGGRLPESFCEREDAFQARVLIERESDTAALLATPIADSPVNALLHPRLYWSTRGEAYSDEQSLALSLAPAPGAASLAFELPHGTDSLHSIRFHPADENRPFDSGYLNVESVQVVADGGNRPQVRFSLDGEDLVLKKATLTALSVVQVGGERLLAVSGESPSLEIATALSSGSGGPMRVEIVVRYTPSRDYRLAHRDFLVKEAALKARNEALEGHLRRVEAELDAIKRSRGWRVLNAVRSRLR